MEQPKFHRAGLLGLWKRKNRRGRRPVLFHQRHDRRVLVCVRPYTGGLRSDERKRAGHGDHGESR
ncbi:hypothetical protein OUZ56_014790 [Daphnia magna]|uniref:Uncharacterized protein n=1 Tax=Daphnia magna TaxID=35525 RepID=A0ABR0AKV4_9CRUS|nr:hypothetical protein OUZ56_014790 [Daphnia magna]